MPLRTLVRSLGLCAALLGPGAARAQATPDVQGWLSDLVTRIDKADRARSDPSGAKARGTVTIRVQVAADGFVNRVFVERSSGSPDLDARALAAARSASPFTPPPPALLTRAGITELSFPLRLARRP
ncbi:energy transducer TonB [Methylobacterium planeticum]|uniref:TonB C-terminal domain-containing protein n=1 Tax=Methylobacterium planeticum TaxID=2615211 RepID=A0A6N6MUT2_9HYPH|nr:TonB family protein [Methylobacterium planeticum]KAB1074366.1 TonB C-terminal domain-containing protein [Methylobacterium planeticum]